MGFVDVVICLEIAVMIGVIFLVPYTEIDWRAYMEEVEGFLKGQLDYTKLKGGTGPLVYPGGFVWIYSALFYITKGGTEIAFAQWIFAGVYWAFLATSLSFYYRGKGIRKPARLFVSMLFSKRIRSLFVLRLFNDCWAMLLAFVAITILAERRHHFRWLAGCVFYSLAVSTKMNVLLFAPGLLYVMLRSLHVVKVVFFLGVCALWQLIAGYPFLLYNWRLYLNRAFELGRVFTKRWSVNFQFLPNDVFVDPILGKALLCATVLCWALLWRKRWCHRTYYIPKTGKTSGNRRGHRHRQLGKTGEAALTQAEETEEAEESAKDEIVYHAVVLTLLESNLVGVVLARSLHYQFYTWFFYSVPFILFYTRLPGIVALGAFALVRQGFESYPPSENSSRMVVAGFCVMLYAVIFMGCEEGRDAYAARCLEEKAANAAKKTAEAEAGLQEKKAQ